MVAAVLILLVAIIPAKYYTAQEISSDLVFVVVKKGKGSGESRGSVSRQEDPRVLFMRQVADSMKGTDAEEIRDPETGVVSSLTFRITKKRYPTLYQLMMQEGMEMNLPEKPARGFSPYVTIRVNFPVRHFLTGDFNADSLSDIALFQSGGVAGESWFVLWNEGNGIFSSPVPASFPAFGKYYPGGTRLLSGDMNGDGRDDLVVYQPAGMDGSDWSVFLNDTAGNFSPVRIEVTGSVRFTSSDSVIPLVCDFNGDDLDDIGIHVLQGADAGRWIVSFNLGNIRFGPPAVFPGGTGIPSTDTGYLPLVMDYNGDGWDDAVQYHRKGPRAPAWDVAVNRKNGTFAPGFRFLYAFLGDYTVLPGDFDGDGYSDILIKAGRPDEAGDWLIVWNQGGQGFRIVPIRVISR